MVPTQHSQVPESRLKNTCSDGLEPAASTPPSDAWSAPSEPAAPPSPSGVELMLVPTLDDDDALEPEYETELDVPCTVPLCTFTDAAPEPALLVASVRTRKLASELREYGINTDFSFRSGPFIHRCLMSIPVARTLEEVFAETQDVPLFVALPTVGATCTLERPELAASRLERPLRDWLTPALPGVAGLHSRHGLRVHFAAFNLLPSVEVCHA